VAALRAPALVVEAVDLAAPQRVGVEARGLPAARGARTMTNKDVRGVCQAVADVYAGTGFVANPLGRFTAPARTDADGQYDRVRIRHHDSDCLNWKEIDTLELTPADTVATLLARCRAAIESRRTRWRLEAVKAEQRLLRAGRTQGEL
jgi:hypothetical protein